MQFFLIRKEAGSQLLSNWIWSQENIQATTPQQILLTWIFTRLKNVPGLNCFGSGWKFFFCFKPGKTNRAWAFVQKLSSLVGKIVSGHSPSQNMHSWVSISVNYRVVECELTHSSDNLGLIIWPLCTGTLQEDAKSYPEKRVSIARTDSTVFSNKKLLYVSDPAPTFRIRLPRFRSGSSGLDTL